MLRERVGVAGPVGAWTWPSEIWETSGVEVSGVVVLIGLSELMGLTGAEDDDDDEGLELEMPNWEEYWKLPS